MISVGLVLDIVGATLMFIYGVPQIGALLLEKADEERRKRQRIGRWGVLLLIVGFCLQLIGVWV